VILLYLLINSNSNGNFIWALQQPTFNTPNTDDDPSIAIDNIGNIYVTYSTFGTVSGQTNIGGNTIDVAVIKITQINPPVPTEPKKSIYQKDKIFILPVFLCNNNKYIQFDRDMLLFNNYKKLEEYSNLFQIQPKNKYIIFINDINLYMSVKEITNYIL
jgi:hypothetical protein